MDYTHCVLTVAVIAIVTAALRFLPFCIFNGKRKTPNIVIYLGRVLPYSVMAMLVIYCFKNISFAAKPFGLPEIIAGVCVSAVHLYKRNTLFSIILGTVVYMLMIQLVFV